MRKCARIMGGDVSITFNPERTIFKLAIPAKPVAGANLRKKQTPAHFTIPKNTWGVVLDDSKVQRKLLGHLLSVLGIHEDRRVVLGETADEVRHFPHEVKSLIANNPDSKFIVIADENLDFVDSAEGHLTLSGSICVEKLRKVLEPLDESRLLALVRSANDSSTNIEAYLRRAHGFIPKEPIHRDKIHDMIRPLWDERFQEDTVEVVEVPARSLSSTSTASSDLGGNSGAASSTSSADLVVSVDALDKLILQNVSLNNDDIAAKFSRQWTLIREKFLTLKGDMMTLTDRSTPRVTAVIEALEDLRVCDSCPVDIQSRWKLIRALIISLV